MDGRKVTQEQGLRERLSYVQCSQGLAGVTAGRRSLMKKRLRLIPRLTGTTGVAAAGRRSLMKKRLRPDL